MRTLAKRSMIKESIIAGAIFGVVFTVLGAAKAGLETGLVAGVASGVFFGGMLYLFVNSPTVRRQVSVHDNDLLPGERVLASDLANLVVEPKKFALPNFAIDDFFWTVGMKNKESLGGALHLTNFRLLFKSHRLNRLRGKTSIFLPTIIDLTNNSRFLVRKLTVSTVSAKVELIVKDVDQVIEDIWMAKRALSTQDAKALQALVVANPQLAGDGLETWNKANTVNNVMKMGGVASEAARLVVNPVGALSSIFLMELVDKTVAERWQKGFK